MDERPVEHYVAGLRERLAAYLPGDELQAAGSALTLAIDEVDPYGRMVSAPLAEVRAKQAQEEERRRFQPVYLRDGRLTLGGMVLAHQEDPESILLRDEMLWWARREGCPSLFEDAWKAVSE